MSVHHTFGDAKVAAIMKAAESISELDPLDVAALRNLLTDHSAAAMDSARRRSNLTYDDIATVERMQVRQGASASEIRSTKALLNDIKARDAAAGYAKRFPEAARIR
jgi:hypothetical protein